MTDIDNYCEVKTNKPSNIAKIHKESFNGGINVCVWFLFSCFVVHLGMESYAKHGIVKDPLQLTLDFIEHINNYWWLYISAFLCVCIQILLCFSIEKLLIWKTVSEKVGLPLHIFNSLLTLNILAVLFNMYQCNPVVGHYVITLVFFHPLKFWSYISINRNLRLKLQISQKENDSVKTKTNSSDIMYPQNVTLQNLAEFVATTHLMTYDINGVKKKPRDFKKAFKLICYSIVTHYLIAFLIYQLVFPEAEVASQYILRGNYLNLIGTGFRLAIPVFIVWILFFYYYCFECYMVLFGCIWGTEDVETLKDWWNAETTSAYWAKWNYQAHSVFKNCIFIPVLKMGYTKRQASLVVFFITGIWHEYLLVVPCQTGYGVILSGMLTQVPFDDITTYLYKRFGAATGSFAFWSILISGEVLSTIILYYKYNYNNSLSFF